MSLIPSPSFFILMNNNENVPSCESQCGKIRAWLLEGRPITSWQAIMMFGCTRLSARIFNLREKGMDIKVRKKITGNGAVIAEYYL